MSALPADLIGGAILGAVFFALIATGEAWARLGDPAPETTRKFVHLGSGLACLLFPVLVDSPWVVLAMALVMSAFFGLASKYDFLQSVHGVDRESRGSEYYPLAVFLVFLLAGDQPWIYVSSVLILGVADACAALVGSRWGILRYTVQTDKKSVEGSFAFFLIAFAAIVLPAAYFGTFSAEKVLLCGGIGALLLTGFEAISLDGSDNLFVPVGACVILAKQATDPVWMLVDQALVLLGLLVALLVLNRGTKYLTHRRQTAFNTGATVASTMVAYAAWTLGGVLWAVPVLVLFAGFTTSWMMTQFLHPAREKIAVRTTYRALLLPFGVLFFANTFDQYDFWYGPFLAACAAVLAFAVSAQLRRAGTSAMRTKRTPLAVGIASALAVVAIPWSIQSVSGIGAPSVVTAMMGPLTLLNAHVTRRRWAEPDDSFWPAPHLLITVLAIALTASAQYAGLVEPWSPVPWNAPK